MTGPIRSNPSSQTPRAGSSAPQQPPVARGTGQSSPGGPALGRPPARPSGPAAGASSMRRATLPPTTRALSAGASSSSGSAAASHRTQLGQAAQRLGELEQRRAALAARLDEAKEVRQTHTSKGNNAELRKLQDRVQHAAGQLQRLREDRAVQLGKLEKAERLLESCERSLQALSLDDTPAPRREAPETAVPSRPTSVEASPETQAPRISPEEAAAQKRVGQLTDGLKRARADMESAKQVLAEARKDVEKAKALAEAVVDPDIYTERADRLATAGLGNYLRSLGLPAVDQPPPRGQPDTRFDAYVEHFTELGADGSRTLKAAFQEPREAFAAFSAMHGAMQANTYTQSLLNRLLPADVTAISVSLRHGGQDLEAIVRPMLVDTFHEDMRMSQGLVESADRTANAMLPRRSQLSTGSSITRTEIRAVAERNRVMLQVQQMPMHRATIISGAVHQTCDLLRGIVLPDRARALEEVAAATARLDEAKASQRPAFQRSIDAERELGAAREELRALVDQRREQEATAPKAAAPTRTGRSEAAIPQVEIASSSSGDAEARQLKLRGDITKHTESAEEARKGLEQLDADIARAVLDLRRAEDQFETADNAQARGRAGARRQHAEQRQEVGRLRRELDEVDAELAQARTAFDRNPARQALMSDRAWDRAVERHVEPDDASLRARARHTGYAGAYASRSDMARAVTEIHEEISQRPEFQAVLAARTRVDFERAAAAVPGGVTDLVHDHGREVGRGFSNDLDQTERPTSLTQSNFSLQFVQGRVVVSHLYPYVPHRQLTTAT
ncbi:hypothetical protein [Ideonella sp. YS5]|uniref:hypothetical protein n=1 Tax=Ideonella sp. YS5 TaxID=3453714 RepID=UPI003EEB119A